MGIISTIIGSYRKSKRLQKISKKLGKKLSMQELMDIATYAKNNETALEELVDLCESDLNVRAITNNYNIGRDDLKELYRLLNNPGIYSWNNGNWVAGHHVPSSSIVFSGTLDFILRNHEKLLNGSTKEQAYICERVQKW